MKIKKGMRVSWVTCCGVRKTGIVTSVVSDTLVQIRATDGQIRYVEKDKLEGAGHDKN